MRFLTDGKILQEVWKLVNGNKELLAAVAFWGRGAGQQTGITERKARTRILCDLLSGACNPYEVRLLLKKGVEVKYRPHLHAKVWMSGNEAVVGSANASTNGLGFEIEGSNIEAAVYLRDTKIVSDIRKWFKCEWKLAENIDEALLQKAEAIWNQRQNTGTGKAINKCFIIAYKNKELSKEARSAFDKIAHDYYNEQQRDSIKVDAKQYQTHEADTTCYEFVLDGAPPTIGTVFMDYSCTSDDLNFQFSGFWEVIHNEVIRKGGYTLCLLEKKDGRKFPMPPSCGDHSRIATMIKCYLDRKGWKDLHMKFETFYFLQQERYCNKVQEQCGDRCPFANMDG